MVADDAFPMCMDVVEVMVVGMVQFVNQRHRITPKMAHSASPGKALVVKTRQKKITKWLSSWSDPGKKITKVVGPTAPPRLSSNY